MHLILLDRDFIIIQFFLLDVSVKVGHPFNCTVSQFANSIYITWQIAQQINQFSQCVTTSTAIIWNIFINEAVLVVKLD